MHCQVVYFGLHYLSLAIDRGSSKISNHWALLSVNFTVQSLLSNVFSMYSSLFWILFLKGARYITAVSSLVRKAFQSPADIFSDSKWEANSFSFGGRGGDGIGELKE